MERSSETIQLDLATITEMLCYHEERAAHYLERKTRLIYELNRARRLEREAKELQS